MLTFKAFLTEEAVAKKPAPKTQKGRITHIEELPVDKFIDAVENLNKMIATQKLDGANLRRWLRSTCARSW